MKISRLVFGLAVAGCLLLAYRFLPRASNDQSAPHESAAEAKEPEPGEPAPEAFEGRDPFQRSSPGDVPQPPASRPTAAENEARGESDSGDEVPTGRRAAKASADPRVRQGVVAFIDDAEIPAEENGKLIKLRTALKDKDGKPVLKDGKVQWDKEIKEGTEVSEGDLIAQIDDSQPRMAKRVAEAEFKAADAEAHNRESIKHAEATLDVATEEYNGAQEADRLAPKSITRSEMRKLQFKCVEAQQQINQAEVEHTIAGLKANAAKAKSEAADLDIDRRQIKAPFSGEIYDRFKHEGEWVKPGDRVYRLVRFDRLQIRTRLDPKKLLPADVDRKPVTVKLELPHQARKTFQGRIRFASQIVDVGRGFLVIVEVENKKDDTGHWVLRPGDFPDVTVETDGQAGFSAAGEEDGPAREIVAGRSSMTPQKE